MALTLGPNGLTMADGSTITMGGQPRSIRWTSTADNITQTSNGNGDVYMNLELTMPAAVDNDSIYLLYGFSNFDDTNSATRGIGLSFWVEQSGQSEWVGRQGYHAHYETQGGDRYYNQHYYCMDNKWADSNNRGNSMRPVAGQTRKYRMYNMQNNNNMTGNVNYITAQAGPSGFFMCMELDGNLGVSGYGKTT